MFFSDIIASYTPAVVIGIPIRTSEVTGAKPEDIGVCTFSFNFVCMNYTLTFSVSFLFSLLIGSALIIQMCPKRPIQLVEANNAIGAAKLALTICAFGYPQARLGFLLG